MLQTLVGLIPLQSLGNILYGGYTGSKSQSFHVLEHNLQGLENMGQ